jgi:predicted GNAT family acetyltransferase
MPDVRDNTAANRFELPLPDGALAFIDYRLREGAHWLTHAEVPPAWEGRGVGSRLVEGTLERIRAAGGRVVPVCSFVVAWMHRHPGYDDLRQRT